MSTFQPTATTTGVFPQLLKAAPTSPLASAAPLSTPHHSWSTPSTLAPSADHHPDIPASSLLTSSSAFEADERSLPPSLAERNDGEDYIEDDTTTAGGLMTLDNGDTANTQPIHDLEASYCATEGEEFMLLDASSPARRAEESDEESERTENAPAYAEEDENDWDVGLRRQEHDWRFQEEAGLDYGDEEVGRMSDDEGMDPVENA
ncbi:uncharacterized protein EV422DRAFT_514790 [Fimicolochytrium jonesii]|uniref:uncharacterized protein n=1 Tax=Fimicolochytrium jonesii TaxID=1396493 RepID=UPI0022FDD0B1|nr:uncharacterized protein EV422DRAFT_514790 [Fimicolochytrium jonesii]KAI8825948.1 hypothetical protein EV422DRAFT_514790 [Fimicolochytrium jonesii]